MADISCDILVVGAGVLGLCTAAELAARGRDVRVMDPGGANASSVAAGMIAPAFESLLDGSDVARAALLRDAAALWPALARRIGVELDTTPAEWRGGDRAAVADRLEALGFPPEVTRDGVRAPGDVRIDPDAALAGLAATLVAPPLIAEAGSVDDEGSGWRVWATGESVEARHLVVATGAGSPLSGLPPSIAALISGIEPIAGQIGRSGHALTAGVLRGPDGYVAASAGGMLIGATMVAGSRDLTPDVGAARRLTRAAERLVGSSLAGPIQWVGGVRGATADGLPLAGPTGVRGLHLALAPRRNGWLLGPLVGRIVADGIERRPPGVHAAALDPLRFSRPAG